MTVEDKTNQHFNPSPLGIKIKALREERRWSLSDAARRAGMARQQLWKIEKGVTATAKGEVLEKLASAFGISVAQLLGQTGTSGRNELLRRLLLSTESISDEDWLLLEQIAKRVTTANLAKSGST